LKKNKNKSSAKNLQARKTEIENNSIYGGSKNTSKSRQPISIDLSNTHTRNDLSEKKGMKVKGGEDKAVKPKKTI